MVTTNLRRHLHPKKSHVVKACSKGKEKLIRFGEQAKLEKVSEAKAYLASTDWIVTKIAELQLEGVDVEPLKTKYADELAERKLMREVV